MKNVNHNKKIVSKFHPKINNFGISNPKSLSIIILITIRVRASVYEWKQSLSSREKKLKTIIIITNQFMAE